MTAKKLMVLTKYSNELNEDAVLNIGDDLAGEIAYAFALKEDQCGFTGDWHQHLWRDRRRHECAAQCLPWQHPANVMGLTTASGSGYAGWDMVPLHWSDFNCVVACCRNMRMCREETAWYCSKFFWGSVMQKLAPPPAATVSRTSRTGQWSKPSWVIP